MPSLGLKMPTLARQSKPPLGKAKHIYKKIGSLYEENKTTKLLKQEESLQREREQYASQVLSEHDRSQRCSSAASDKARRTCDSLKRTIRTSMEVKKQYDDTVNRLNNTCRARLIDMHFELKK